MTPRGDLPRVHSHHREYLGSDRCQQMPPSTSRLSRRRVASNNLHRDLESIRARRAKLEALTTSVRLPPLIPSDISGVYSSSAALTYTLPRTHTASKQRLHRLRKGEQHPITSISLGDLARPHRPSSKLPLLLARQMTPLPKIEPVAETSKQVTKETQGNPKSPTPSPSPSHVTPTSPIICQEEEDKPNYFQIVQEMKGVENNNRITDPKNTAVTTRDTTAFANDTVANVTGDTTAFANDTVANVTKTTTGIINEATSNDTELNTGNTLSDVMKLSATVKARKLLSTSSDIPSEQFLEAGILEAAKINLNTSSSADLLFETVWVISNIASGELTSTQAIEVGGLIKPLVQLVESGESKIKDKSIWALSNLATQGEVSRNKILEAGFLHHLIDSIRNYSTMSQLSHSTWALSNIFRTPNWTLTNEEVTLAISVVKDICLSSENKEVLVEALWCLEFMTSVDSTIQPVIEADILPLVTPHLKSPDQKVQTPAVKVAGNIVATTDVQTDAALEAGILAPIHNILKNSAMANQRKDAAWVLSNIAAGPTQQVQKLLDEGVLLTLYDVISKDSNNVVKEAAWALTNLVADWTTDQRRQFVDSGGVDSLASLIVKFQKEASSSTLLERALDSIDIVLTEDSDNVNRIKNNIEEAIGLDILLELRTHDDATVVSTVNKLLSNHFPDLVELNSGGGSDEANMDNTSLPGTASKYVAGE